MLIWSVLVILLTEIDLFCIKITPEICLLTIYGDVTKF